MLHDVILTTICHARSYIGINTILSLNGVPLLSEDDTSDAPVDCVEETACCNLGKFSLTSPLRIYFA